MSTEMSVRTLLYPGKDLPGYPAFEVSYPSGWRTDEMPDAIAVMYDPASTGFRTNVVIGFDRVPGETTLAGVAAGSFNRTDAKFTDFKVKAERNVRVGGQPALMRFQTFQVVSVRRNVLQMHVLLFAPTASHTTKDLFHLQATCLLDEADRYMPMFTEIVRSVRFMGSDPARRAAS